MAGGEAIAGQLSRVARLERKLSNAALYQLRLCAVLCAGALTYQPENRSSSRRSSQHYFQDLNSTT